MQPSEDFKEVILYDLEALKDNALVSNMSDFNYHFNFLKGNLTDLFEKMRGCK